MSPSTPLLQLLASRNPPRGQAPLRYRRWRPACSSAGHLPLGQTSPLIPNYPGGEQRNREKTRALTHRPWTAGGSSNLLCKWGWRAVQEGPTVFRCVRTRDRVWRDGVTGERRTWLITDRSCHECFKTLIVSEDWQTALICSGIKNLSPKDLFAFTSNQSKEEVNPLSSHRKQHLPLGQNSGLSPKGYSYFPDTTEEIHFTSENVLILNLNLLCFKSTPIGQRAT